MAAEARAAPLPLLLLALATASLPGCDGGGDALGERGPRTVVLVSLDTLRPERLGLYGGDPEVSANIDALGAEAIVFDQALANAPWTLPSHMTMLTGMNPVAHGVIHGGRKLPSAVPFLPEILREAGFATAGFTDGGYVHREFGFQRGFDVFEDQREERGRRVNGFRRIMPPALEWLRAQDGDAFLFLHTFDPHAPYGKASKRAKERFRGRTREAGALDDDLWETRFFFQQREMGMPDYGTMGALLDAYDAGVFDADRGVGQLVAALRETGRFEDALVIVTADHGESFLDHGIQVGHGLGLTDDQLSIPMLVKFPGGIGAGERSDALVDLTDLFPTVLDVLAIEVADPESLREGESLLRAARGEPRRRSYVFGASVTDETYCLVRGGYKYVTPIGVPPMLVARRVLGPDVPPSLLEYVEVAPYGVGLEDRKARYDDELDPLGLRDRFPTGARLYDRGADPHERDNLAERMPELAVKMTEDLRRILVRSTAVADRLRDPEVETDVSPHLEHQLAQLGYLTTGSEESLEGMSGAMRASLTRPWTAPDTTQLEVSDEAMHRVRLDLERGELDGAGARATLQAAGDRIAAWARAHPELRVRAQWRLLELLDLARRAEVQVDPSDWEDLAHESRRPAGD